jgi:hypothetical protein
LPANWSGHPKIGHLLSESTINFFKSCLSIHSRVGMPSSFARWRERVTREIFAPQNLQSYRGFPFLEPNSETFFHESHIPHHFFPSTTTFKRPKAGREQKSVVESLWVCIWMARPFSESDV